MNIRRCPLLPAFFFIVTAVATILFFPVQPARSGAKDPLECYECHQEDCDNEMSRLYVHIPFLQKQCPTCHVATGASKEIDEEGEEKIAPSVRWIDEKSTPAETHWFLISSARLDGTLIVKAKNGQGKSKHQELVLPQLADLPPMTDDRTPPSISEIKVLEIRRGVFYSARIAWKTDELATSTISYGLGETLSTSPWDDNPSQQHETTLTGLKGKKEYRFTVVAQDLFGNESKSEPLTFSTADTFSAAPAREQSDKVKDTIELSDSLFRKDDNYLVKITANQPVALAIGAEPPLGPGEKKRKRGPRPDSHLPLKSELDTNITVCYSCHTDVKEVLSHPVNVYPKPGMTIPADYPTLADGRITCMSCHAGHGSDIEFRLLRPSKRELCVGCHSDLA